MKDKVKVSKYIWYLVKIQGERNGARISLASNQNTMEKYLNDAIIGNKNMLATFSSKGEMLRLSYPNHDNSIFIQE